MNIIWILLLWILCDVGKTETNEEDIGEMDDVVTAEVHLDRTSTVVSEWSANLREASLAIMRAGDERFLARREETRRLGGMHVRVENEGTDRSITLDLEPGAIVANLRSQLPLEWGAAWRALTFGGEELNDPNAPLADVGISAEATVFLQPAKTGADRQLHGVYAVYNPFVENVLKLQGKPDVVAQIAFSGVKSDKKPMWVTEVRLKVGRYGEPDVIRPYFGGASIKGFGVMQWSHDAIFKFLGENFKTQKNFKDRPKAATFVNTA